MTNPMKEIEDRQAWLGFGRQAALMYRGSMEEGLNEQEALRVITAWTRGMFSAQYDEPPKGDDS